MASEFTVEGIVYRCLRLSAARQYEILQHVTPILPALTGVDAGLRVPGLTASAISVLFSPLRTAKDEVLDAVFTDTRSAIERLDGEPVGDVSLSGLMMLTAEVVHQNFGALFAMKRPKFEPCPTGDNDKGFGSLGPVEMPNGLDWLYAPMQASFCTYKELHDGSLRIEDVARMNDLLTCKAENEARLRLAAEI